MAEPIQLGPLSCTTNDPSMIGVFSAERGMCDMRSPDGASVYYSIPACGEGTGYTYRQTSAITGVCLPPGYTGDVPGPPTPEVPVTPPSSVPPIPSLPAGTCPPGQYGYYPLCYSVPGSTPPSPAPAEEGMSTGAKVALVAGCVGIVALGWYLFSRK